MAESLFVLINDSPEHVFHVIEVLFGLVGEPGIDVSEPGKDDVDVHVFVDILGHISDSDNLGIVMLQ